MGYLSTVIVLLCTVSLAQGQALAVPILTARYALGFATDVLKIVDFVMGKNSDKGQINQDKLLSDLENHINTAKTELLTSIILRSKLERVDDAVIAIQSSLTDVHNILKAQRGVQELAQIFEDRFADNGVIMHVRFLRTLLTYVSPGDTLDLITLVREGKRCARDSLNAFRSFYLQLIVDGATLELLFLSLTTENVDIDTFFQDWVNVTLQADAICASQIPICAQRFPSDVLTDLKANENVTVLRSELDKRYPDRNIDIFFYSGIGTNQFHALRYTKTKHNFFWDRGLNTVNKVLVVTDNNGKPNWNKAATKSKLENCLKDVSVDEEDSRAAENVLIKVATCDGLTYTIDTAIVYFESDDFPTTAIKTYSDSPVVELSVEGVTLKYCFKTVFDCGFSKDESTGRFRIFAYPNFHDDVTESDYRISGSFGIRARIWPLTLIVLFVTIVHF